LLPPRISRILACGLAAALWGCTSGLAADPAPAGETFDDPAAIAKEFSAELTQLAKDETLVSPEDLAKQAEKEETCLLETPSPGAEKLSAEAVYARARSSVLVVGGISKAGKGRARHPFCATGFAIHKDGVIVTNFHVLAAFHDLKAVGVMTADRHVYPIEAVLAADKRNDVAVLKIKGAALAPLPLATRVPVGATVYCLSHPVLNSQKTESGFYTFTSGIVSARLRLRIAEGKPVDVLAITADYATGSSGGPILNEQGAVVGMVCQTLPIFSDAEEVNVQMVWKFSRPASSILALVSKPKAAAKPPAAGDQ
jgi:S1-C subfamily serine protease